MDFNATIDLIVKDLDNAREIIDDLKSYPGVPSLQIELAKSKCKAASELIALLKKVPDDIDSNDISSTLDALRSPLDLPQPSSPITDAPVSEATNSTLNALRSTLDPPQPQHEPQPQSQPQPQPHLQDSFIIADSFSHLSNRINEQLGGLIKDDMVADFNKSGHVSNLSEAIGVNDRFLFIREIFNDNKDAYIEAIARLDSTESLIDAKAVVMSYTGNNNENEAIKQLLDLVKRKLSSNE